MNALVDAGTDAAERLKTALQKFPAAVTVVSVRTADGDFLATTATAVTVLTMAPPTMLVCINRSTMIASALERSARFAINVLRSDQQHIAAACAGGMPHPDRERVGDWKDELPYAPVLQSAQASIVCEPVQFLAYGTHDVVFGQVADVRWGEGLNPLMYLNRAYGQFQPAAEGARHA
jgi:flavin reductase (DIM6/NTAB) family NADH-FMN oxidoreductase RutF